jgi:hypothetical protein
MNYSRWVLMVEKWKGTDTLEHLVNEQETIFLFVCHKSNNHPNCANLWILHTKHRNATQQQNHLSISDLESLKFQQNMRRREKKLTSKKKNVTVLNNCCRMTPTMWRNLSFIVWFDFLNFPRCCIYKISFDWTNRRCCRSTCAKDCQLNRETQEHETNWFPYLQKYTDIFQ